MTSLRVVLAATALSVLSLTIAATGFTAASPAVANPTPNAASNWPSFRGPGGAGVSEARNLPSEWNVEDGRNVAWALDVPGVSHSSPVIWDHHVFVITAVSDEPGDAVRARAGSNNPASDRGRFDWRLYNVDRRDGEVSWVVSAHEGRPRTARHQKATHANSTPATDGTRVVAIFGSEGMYCYDMAGNLLWHVDLGVLDTGLYGDPGVSWGYAASPTIHGDRVFVQVDKHSGSYLAAFRLEDGGEIWRTPRREKNTWSTPTIYEHEGREVLVTNGGNFIRGYDPANGEEVWRFADDAEVKVPTPFFASGKIILAGGYPQGRPVYAFDAGVEGDISREPTALAWRIPRGGPYTATPVALADYLYSVTDQGILSVYELDTGEMMYRERLAGGFSASPVAADGKIYLASEDGVIYTLAAGPTFDLLGTVDMGEPLFATPALVDDMIVIRGANRLFGIGAVTTRP